MKVENSLAFYKQLTQHKITAELYLYDDAAHGYGLHIPGTGEEWIESLVSWLKSGKPFKK